MDHYSIKIATKNECASILELLILQYKKDNIDVTRILNTCLKIASNATPNKIIIELLVKYGACNINESLIKLVTNNHTYINRYEIIKFLIDSGADNLEEVYIIAKSNTTTCLDSFDYNYNSISSTNMRIIELLKNKTRNYQQKERQKKEIFKKNIYK